jgi:hypothetical protein
LAADLPEDTDTDTDGVEETVSPEDERDAHE